jgi:hypothetical protein
VCVNLHFCVYERECVCVCLHVHVCECACACMCVCVHVRVRECTEKACIHTSQQTGQHSQADVVGEQVQVTREKHKGVQLLCFEGDT